MMMHYRNLQFGIPPYVSPLNNEEDLPAASRVQTVQLEAENLRLHGRLGVKTTCRSSL